MRWRDSSACGCSWRNEAGFPRGPLTLVAVYSFFSNLLVVAISWSILELGHVLRPSAAGQIGKERERWVMFLIQDPYIPPKRAARGGSGIKPVFRACRTLFSAIRRVILHGLFAIP